MSSQMYPGKTKIQRYYEGKTIFLTGGTGFLGKVLVEKILRCCPNVKQIFLLMREKRGMKAEERLKKLLQCEVFARHIQGNPEISRKLSVIPGDLSRPQLGLSPEHVAVISQNVQIIFHSAATLRFDERISVAISTNVAATKQLCLLAQNMLKLEAFVYVSTAYCNCDSPLVQEKVSGCRISPENLINLPNLLDEKTLDEVTPVLLGSKPNSYIFTKCAAEVIIDKFKTSLPVAIFRPSIVLSSESEPFPGWIDNVSGPTGMAASLSAGLLHTTHFKYGAKVNLVPVDYTVNGIIALGYSVGSCKWVSPGEMPVVNFVSTADNTITWGKFGDLLNHYMWQYPSAKLHWYPFTVRAGHHWSYVGLRTLFHYFPAALVDWATARLGQPTKLIQFYRRLDKYAAVVVYFSTREFKFEEGNADRLWNSLDSTDQEMFPFNMAAMDWNVYLRSYVLGCRQFLLKEEHNTIVESRKRIKMLYFLHLLTASAFFFLFYKFTVHFGRLFGKKPSLGRK